MPYSVAGKAAYITNAKYWYPLLKLACDAHPSDDIGLGNVYYDGQGCVYKMRDLSGDAVTFSNAMAQSLRAPYRDYWVIGQRGGQGYRIFAHGLAEDWLRDNTQTTSKTAVVNYLDTLFSSGGAGPYAATSAGAIASLPDIAYSRECAYALMCMLEDARLGTSINTTWRDQLKTWSLGHITMWLTTRIDGLTKFFLRPFMVALTIKALIQYHEQATPLTAGQITSIVNLAEFIWNTLWNYGGAAGTNSFAYTDRKTSLMSPNVPNTPEQAVVYNSGDDTATNDLNQLIFPVFGWCWKQTGDQKWRDRCDAIFQAGVSVYSQLDLTYNGGGYWISGAYFGAQTVAGVSGKQIDQSHFWASDGIAWAEGPPVGSPPPPPPGTAGKNYYNLTMGCGCGTVLKYNVTGAVTYNGVGLAGVTITSAALGNTTTDANGNYSLPNITPGTVYTITPTLAGYTFTPTSTSGTLNADTSVNFTAALSSYDPIKYFSGATKQFWYDMNDTTKVLNGSSTQALNNQTVGTVNDEWGSSVSLSQGTDANRAVLKTGIANSRQAIEFTGSPQTMPLTNFASALNGATKIVVGAVFKLNSIAANAGLFRCYDHSFSYNRLLCYLLGGAPAIQGAAADGSAGLSIYATSWGGNTSLSLAAVHAVLFQWDVANSTFALDVDNASAQLSSTIAPGTSIAATTLNQPEIGITSGLDLLEEFMVTGALMTNKNNWFADVKTRYGITAY